MNFWYIDNLPNQKELYNCKKEIVRNTLIRIKVTLKLVLNYWPHHSWPRIFLWKYQGYQTWILSYNLLLLLALVVLPKAGCQRLRLVAASLLWVGGQGCAQGGEGSGGQSGSLELRQGRAVGRRYRDGLRAGHHTWSGYKGKWRVQNSSAIQTE